MTRADDIETEVRAMLSRRAGDIEPSQLNVPDVADLDVFRLSPLAPSYGHRPASRRLIGATAIAVVAALAVLVLAVQGTDDASTPVNAGVPTTLPSPSSAPRLPTMTGGFFAGEDTPERVTVSYLRDRLHVVSGVVLSAEATSVTDDFATVRWHAEWSGFVTDGFAFLRRDGASWNVVAATSDGVDLSGLVRDGDRVYGVVRNSTTQPPLSADVLRLDGTPVPAAPFPDGVPGAHYLYATAARSNGPELPIDIAVPDEPVIVRIHTVGGTLLSVSELRFDPPRNPELCAKLAPPYVFSWLPNGWAVSLNSAWLAGQPPSAREGLSGPGRIESGIDTAVYIEIALGVSPVERAPVGTPLAVDDPPRLEGAAATTSRTADGFEMVFDTKNATCSELHIVFHGVDQADAVRIANGLQRV